MAVAIVGIAAVAGVVLAPWFRVANHPVRFETNAPLGTRIRLCWAEDSTSCVPFIPHDERLTVGLWLAELPPFPHYRLRVFFPDGVSGLSPARLVVLRTDFIRVALERILGGPKGLNILPGGSVEVGELGDASAGELIWRGVIVFVIVSVGLGALASLVMALQRNRSLGESVVCLRPGLMLAFALPLALGYAALIAQRPIFAYGDSEGYIRAAFDLAGHHAPGVGNDPWTKTSRTPGYPLFLGALFALFGGKLSTVVMVQALMTVAAVSALGFSLRHLVPSSVVGAVVVAGVAVPMSIFSSAAILSDALAVGLMLVAVATFIEAQFSAGRRAVVMLVTFSLAVALAALTRPPAVIACVLPVLLAVGVAITAWRATSVGKVSVSAQAVAPLLVTLVPVALALGGWAAVNKVRYDYFGVSSYGPTIRFAGLMETGSFDARSLAAPDLYASYITGREAAHYWQFHVQMVGILAGKYPPTAGDYVRSINRRLEGVIAASDGFIAPQLRAARFVRELWWGTAFPDESDYNGLGMRGGWEYPALDYQRAAAERLSADFPGVAMDPHLPEGFAATMLSAISQRHYDVVRPGVYVAALMAAALALYLGGVAAAAPMILHAANLLFYAWVGVVHNRYVQGLDPLLFAQIAIATGLLWRRRMSHRRASPGQL